MTKRLLHGLSAAIVAAVLVAPAVPAQAAEIKCSVPFSFIVNGQTLPPGDYTLSGDVVGGVLIVRGLTRGVVVLTHGAVSPRYTPPQIVFHRYDDQYILRQAWMGGTQGLQLSAPRLKGETAKTARNGNVASTFERVVVPAL